MQAATKALDGFVKTLPTDMQTPLTMLTSMMNSNATFLKVDNAIASSDFNTSCPKIAEELLRIEAMSKNATEGAKMMDQVAAMVPMLGSMMPGLSPRLLNCVG